MLIKFLHNKSEYNTINKDFENVIDKNITLKNECDFINPYLVLRTDNVLYSCNYAYIPDFKSTNSSVISGIEISGESMNDYGKKSRISGEDYVSKFFFNPVGTWHGGDWHGGYGAPANFNAYNEMINFYKYTVKDFRKKYEI